MGLFARGPCRSRKNDVFTYAVAATGELIFKNILYLYSSKFYYRKPRYVSDSTSVYIMEIIPAPSKAWRQFQNRIAILADLSSSHRIENHFGLIFLWAIGLRSISAMRLLIRLPGFTKTSQSKLDRCRACTYLLHLSKFLIFGFSDTGTLAA